jgi:O-antigen/teichoic acid export membrane protein
MAERLFFQPLNLLQASFRSVYTQHLVTALRKGRRLTPILLKGCLFTGGAMLPPTLLLMLYGEPGVVWLLGDKWRMAGVFIEITAPLIIFASMAVPAGAAMVVCRQQRRLLVQQIVTTVIVVLGFVFSYFVWRTPEAAVRTMMVLLVVRNLYMIWISFIVVRRFEQKQPTEQEKN